MISSRERLAEAVAAMRSLGSKLAMSAEWTERFPHFAQAVRDSPFKPMASDPWTARMTTMHYELTLLMAEAQLEGGEFDAINARIG